MEPRRRQIRNHIIILTILSTLVGVLFFSLIGILMNSEILNTESKIGREDLECPFCEELILELKKEEEEAARKAQEEKIKNATGIVYLTFDDGPSEYTAALLDTLKNYDVKATFFVTGYGDDEMIKREYEEGHAVGLHTWTHQYNIVYSSVENYFDDLSKIAARVKNITGQDANLIRFPGGSSNTVSTRYDHGTKIMSILTREVTNRGYQYFDWNLSSKDAEGATTSDAVFVNVASHLKPGPNVVLQHDTKAFSVEAVARIIEYGLANNYVFLPLDFNAFNAHHGVNN